jgi:RNA polymerase sigma factor (TIGR02999 family)
MLPGLQGTCRTHASTRLSTCRRNPTLVHCESAQVFACLSVVNVPERALSDQRLDDLIHSAEAGDEAARRQLFAALYEELHGIARRQLRRHGFGATLGATTLLHEAYLNLGERHSVLFPDRAHFLAYAARAMRGLIMNYARSRRALKRGAAFEITSLPVDVPEQAVDSVELQRLSDAIERLAGAEPRLAQVVDLKYFGGFSFGDIAAMWQKSERTVQRDWEKARLFLRHVLSSSDEDRSGTTTPASVWENSDR